MFRYRSNIQCGNWVKTWAGAFSKFLATVNDLTLEITNTTAVVRFLQLKLVWVWNIKKTYVFNMKLKVPWPILPEIVFHFFSSSLLVFYKNYNKKCPLKQSELKKFWFLFCRSKLNNISLYMKLTHQEISR